MSVEHAETLRCRSDDRDKLIDHLRTLRNWFMECGSISTDESEHQVTCIDELLEEIGEGAV